MSLSMYAVTIPPMRLMLKNLSAIISKAEQHCEARKIDPSAFLSARLFPDMFPFTRQVQIASDTAKGAAARLAGVEVPKFEDTETTFAELHARLDRTVAFMDSLTPAQFEGADTRTVTLPLRQGPREFTGLEYLTAWANPNLYFHVTTAYALLRHGGVEIGKTDYLAGSLAK
ncbi:MAG TPA: DUF1993 domain-containing protein [Burkholderiaceae bacterium]